MMVRQPSRPMVLEARGGCLHETVLGHPGGHNVGVAAAEAGLKQASANRLP